MKLAARVFAYAIASALAAGPALAATSSPSAGSALVTILPKNYTLAKESSTESAVNTSNLELKLNGKAAPVTSVTRAHGPESPLELVFLIDDSMHASFASMLPSLASFSNELPSDSRMAIAYMQNGRAVFASPLTSNPRQIQSALHIPSGPAGGSGSPYFCLSELAKNWPSQVANARREVVMITDGIDNYEPRFNPDDPYVQAAINDSVRAGLSVFSIYWTDHGRGDRLPMVAEGGQSLLQMVTDATGGKSYWQGTGNPVSIDSYLQDLRTRFRNQYRIGFTGSSSKKAELQTMHLKLSNSDAKLSAPHMVLVAPQAGE
jgi:hypothetical protein